MITAVIVTACSEKNDNPGPSTNDKYTTCLKNFDYQYEKLLTIEDIRKHTSIDDVSLESEIGSIKGEYGYSKHRWASDRPDLKMELLGQTIQYPDRNTVEIKLLSFYSKEDLTLYNQKTIPDLFNMGYKVLSNAEVEKITENYEKEYANDPAGLKNAKELLEIRLKSQYNSLANLGESAYWKWHDEHGIELSVLSGAVTFTIVTKVSADSKKSLDVAVSLAKEVLAKCK